MRPARGFGRQSPRASGIGLVLVLACAGLAVAGATPIGTVPQERASASAAEQPASVTFIVEGMMKSRSGAT